MKTTIVGLLFIAALVTGCSRMSRLCRRDDLTDTQKLDCIRYEQSRERKRNWFLFHGG